MPGYSGNESGLFWIATGKPNALTSNAFRENFSYGFRRAMTWVPIPNAVRKLREAAKLEQRELAKKSGITERAIRLLESKRAPKTMYAATVTIVIDLAEDKSRATVLARVVVKEPVGHRKGFFIFEKRPKPRPFAFVVEHVISEEKPQNRPEFLRPKAQFFRHSGGFSKPRRPTPPTH